MLKDQNLANMKGFNTEGLNRVLQMFENMNFDHIRHTNLVNAAASADADNGDGIDWFQEFVNRRQIKQERELARYDKHLEDKYLGPDPDELDEPQSDDHTLENAAEIGRVMKVMKKNPQIERVYAKLSKND